MIDVMLLEDHFSATNDLSHISTGTAEPEEKDMSLSRAVTRNLISTLDIMSGVPSIHIDI